MNGWQRAALGEVAEIERDGVQPDQIEAGTTYVGLEHIASDGTFDDPGPVEAGELASTKFRFSNHHLLYGKLRPNLAKIACPDFSGICSTDILPIRPGPHVARRYLFHFLRRPEMIAYATSRAVGINLPRLSPAVLEAVELPLPPLSEQRRIADILDRADSLRAARRGALAKLDALTQAIFTEMFGDPQSNPKHWARVALGELLVVGPQNGLYKPSDDYGSGTPIVRIDAFYAGVVTRFADLKRVKALPEEVEQYGLQRDDVVVNRVNSMEYLGKCALIPALNEPTVYESNMMRLRLDTAKAHPRYVVQFLQTAYVKSQIGQAAKHAVNQSSINQQDVKGFWLNLPPLALQQEFAQRVAAIEQLRSAQRASLAQLDALFASLQQRAFRGEL